MGDGGYARKKRHLELADMPQWMMHQDTNLQLRECVSYRAEQCSEKEGEVNAPPESIRLLFSHIQGALVLDGVEYKLDGNGVRDHSWGPRYWSQTVPYRFINGSFGDGLGFTVSAVANGRGHGALQIGEAMVRVTSATVCYRPSPLTLPMPPVQFPLFSPGCNVSPLP